MKPGSIQELADRNFFTSIIDYQECLANEATLTVADLAKYNFISKVDDYSSYDDSEPIEPYVDLGLASGLLWATCNLGATSPTDPGKYYAWADTTGYAVRSMDGATVTDEAHDFDIEHYKHANASGEYIKYIDDYGSMDSSDDAALQELGAGWKIPSASDWGELKDNTDWEIIQENGKPILRFTSREDPSKFILIPAGGVRYDDTLDLDPSCLGDGDGFGFAWSSDHAIAEALLVGFGIMDGDITEPNGMSTGLDGPALYREMGLNIRPVFVPSTEAANNSNDAHRKYVESVKQSQPASDESGDEPEDTKETEEQ